MLWPVTMSPLAETAAAPLSSMALERKYTVKSLPKRLGRLKSDPWAEYRTVRQSITARLLKSIGAE